jgi:periplasmic copper chaperone A
MYRLVILTSAVWLAACAPRDASQGPSAGIVISAPWSRATPPGAGVGVVYFDIRNASGVADTLLGASTPAAARAEIHATSMAGAMMSMSPIESLPLPVAQTQHFAPAGKHLMLIDLAAPLVEGGRIEVTFRFAHAAPQTLQVPVLALGATAAPP